MEIRLCKSRLMPVSVPGASAIVWRPTRGGSPSPPSLELLQPARQARPGCCSASLQEPEPANAYHLLFNFRLTC